MSIQDSRTFRALQYPAYRYWFFGQLVSLFGTWMQMTAQGFLVYELTHSPAYLGYVGFANGLPMWLFLLYGGVMADRISRRKLLIITQSVMMALAMILVALVFSGWIEAYHIILLTFFLGCANAFDAPARQALAADLVDRKDLSNAIALNSSMFNAAAVVGPALAGIAYAFWGAGWCFAINGFSFLAVILALAKMPYLPPEEPITKTKTFDAIREGLSYVSEDKDIRRLILIVISLSLFGVSFSTLFPAWAVDILGGDAKTNGYLQSARGLGSLVGALTIASVTLSRSKAWLYLTGLISFPILLFLFSWERQLELSLLNLVAIGATIMFILNLTNSYVQTIAPDHLRGRVMSVYTLSFMGFMPVGALVYGTASDRIGEAYTVRIASGIFLFVVFYMLLEIRRFFQREIELETMGQEEERRQSA